jgi:2'-hydroxyisoflavone reductase
MREFLEESRNMLNPAVELKWVDQSALLARNVGPWMEMPLWIPTEGEAAHAAYLMGADIRKALAAGLTFRPLAETLRDTADWDAGRPRDLERRAGMSQEREAELLRNG